MKVASTVRRGGKGTPCHAESPALLYVRLSQQAAKWKHFQRLRSLLILRDGRECGDELKGINKAKEELIAKKLLEKEAEVDVVDFHKSIKQV